MGLGTFFSGFSEKIKKLPSIFTGFSSVHSSSKINIKTIIIVAAAFFVIIILLLILLLRPRSKAGTQQEKSFNDYANEPIQRQTLPEEEFFLPYEPDFIPDVLLERDPKETWTEEDAQPFWTDPLEGNEAVWRKRIESEIDSLLENIP